MFGASWIWKANLETVLVEDSRLRRVSGMPGVTEATLTVMVVVASEAEEEAWRFPDMWSEPATVEEALEINPDRFASPPTLRVDDACNGPLTLNWAAIVEEAEEINPPIKEARLSICKVE